MAFPETAARGEQTQQNAEAFIEYDNLELGTLLPIWSDLINKYDWNKKIAYDVMMCESGGGANAHNPNGNTGDNSYGLFQINLYGELADSRPSPEWLLNPVNNVDYAYQLYKRAGWNAWRNCL